MPEPLRSMSSSTEHQLDAIWQNLLPELKAADQEAQVRDAHKKAVSQLEAVLAAKNSKTDAKVEDAGKKQEAEVQKPSEYVLRLPKTMDEIRKEWPDLQLYDNDGRPVDRTHEFGKGEIFAAWSERTGLNGFTVKEGGALENVPLMFSDRIANLNQSEISRVVKNERYRMFGEGRFRRMFDLKADPDEQMPNSEEAKNSEIRLGAAFMEAHGNDQQKARQAAAVMVLGAALEPEKINALKTSSTVSGGDYRNRQYFYMMNWILKLDDRSNGFGVSHKKARDEAAEIARNFDVDHQKKYREMVTRAAECAAENAAGYAETAIDEDSMALYTASLVMKTVMAEDEAFRDQVKKDITPERFELLKSEAALYEMNVAADESESYILNGKAGSFKDFRERMLDAAARRIVLNEISAHKKSLANEVNAALQQSRMFSEIVKTDSSLFTEIQLSCLKEAQIQVRDRFMKKLAEDGGADQLLSEIKKKLADSKEFKKILCMPENCACGEMAAFTSGMDSKQIIQEINETLPEATDRDTVMKILTEGFRQKMEYQYDQDLLEKSDVKARAEWSKKVPIEKRSDFDPYSLVGMGKPGAVEYMLISDEITRNMLLIGRNRSLEKLLEAAKKLTLDLEKGKANERMRMYIEAGELMQQCAAYFNTAGGAKKGSAEEGIQRAVEKISECALVIRDLKKKEIDSHLASQENVRNNWFSTGMHEYYVSVSAGLQELKKAFEDNDPLWLPSNSYVNEFKRLLDQTAELAQECSAMTTADIYTRESLKNALSTLHLFTDDAEEHVHPTSDKGKMRLKVITDACRYCGEMAEAYERDYGKENSRFAEISGQDPKTKGKENNETLNEKMAGPEKAQFESAYNAYFSLRNKISQGAETSETVRKLSMRASVDAQLLTVLPEMMNSHELSGITQDQILTKTAEVMIINAISAERASNRHDLERAFNVNPDQVVRSVKNLAVTADFVKRLGNPASAGCFIKTNSEQINRMLSSIDSLGRFRENNKNENEAVLKA